MAAQIMYQIDTDSLRWENTGGNTMILAACATVAFVKETSYGALTVANRESYWVMVGCDGVGFYNGLHDCPLDLYDDEDPIAYFDWSDVRNSIEIGDGNPVPEKLRDVYDVMTGLYTYYEKCNDNRNWTL